MTPLLMGRLEVGHWRLHSNWILDTWYLPVVAFFSWSTWHLPHNSSTGIFPHLQSPILPAPHPMSLVWGYQGPGLLLFPSSPSGAIWNCLQGLLKPEPKSSWAKNCHRKICLLLLRQGRSVLQKHNCLREEICFCSFCKHPTNFIMGLIYARPSWPRRDKTLTVRPYFQEGPSVWNMIRNGTP